MFVVHKEKFGFRLARTAVRGRSPRLNEGDFFGEMALFTGEPRTANVLALEETEVLEIGHAAMKRVFDTNPDLVESLSFIMAERRQGLASQTDDSATSSHSSAGILSAIKRFFGIHSREKAQKHKMLSTSEACLFLHFVLFVCLFAAKFGT